MRKLQLFMPLTFLSAATLLTPISASAIQIYGTQDTEDKVLVNYHRSDWLKIDSKKSIILKWTCPSNAYIVGGGFETRAEDGNSSNGFTVIHSFLFAPLLANINGH